MGRGVARAVAAWGGRFEARLQRSPTPPRVYPARAHTLVIITHTLAVVARTVQRWRHALSGETGFQGCGMRFQAW